MGASMLPSFKLKKAYAVDRPLHLHRVLHRALRPFFPLIAGAAFAAMAGCASLEISQETAQGPARDVELINERELVVIYGEDVSTPELKRLAAQRGYAVLDETPLAALDLQMLTLEIPRGIAGMQAIREIEALEPRATAGVNHAFKSPRAEAVADPLQYADRLLSWPEGGCVATGAIGLIDTMVDADDAALASARVVSRLFDDADASNTRHGTDVAAIIAAPSRLSDVELYNAAVIGGDAQAAGVDTIAKALDWLAASDVRLVNVSLAGPYNKILDRAVRAAAERRMIIVAAVGNTGADSPPLYPAAFPNTLAVTAVDVDVDVYERAVRGDYIDVAAPGVDVFVETQGVGRFSTGTSIAAPFVTARIAADFDMANAANVDEVRRRLRERAIDLGERGFDEIFGAGLVDAPVGCRPATARTSSL